MSFFPDVYPKNKGPPREYFFNILNTIHPDYLHQVLMHANKQRMSSEGEQMKKQSIEISEYWEEQLRQMPYLSCKFLVFDMDFSASPISSFDREERQDHPPPEIQLQAVEDRIRTQEDQDCRVHLRIPREQEEAIRSSLELASSISAKPDPIIWPDHVARTGRQGDYGSPAKRQGRKNVQQMNESLS